MNEPGRLATAEAWMLRGSGSWFTLGLVVFLAWMGVAGLDAGAPHDEIGTWSPLLASCALAFMFVGTRTQSRLVQRLGVVLMVGWLVLLIADAVT